MDDLLDLNWSAPTSSSTLSTSSGTSKLPVPVASKSPFDFDFLSAPSTSSASRTGSLNARASASARSTPYSSTPPLRNGTPSTAPLPSSSTVPVHPIPRSAAGTPQPRPAQSGASGATKPPNGSIAGSDAFSGLLSLGGAGASGSGGPGGKHLSMAERQKMLEEERKRKEEHERAQFDHGAFWEKHGSDAPSPSSASGPSSGFDDLLSPSLATATATATRQAPPSSSARLPAPEILAPTPAPAQNTKSKAGTLWDNPAFLSPSSAPSPRPTSSAARSVTASSSTSTSARITPAPRSPQPPVDPFDFDALDAATSEVRPYTNTNTSASGRNGTSGMRTPVSDFDFGDREGGEEEDDFLGELGQPARPRPETGRAEVISFAYFWEWPVSYKSRTDKEQPAPASKTKLSGGRTSSPPPHVVGQIVEMGFSPAQARAALAKTATGVDVEAALETLLAASHGNGEDEDDHGFEVDEDRVEMERRRREESERERRRARRAGPSRDSVRPRTQEERDLQSQSRRQGQGQGQEDSAYGAQADKMLAQASEIGQSMFSKASTLWAVGRDRAMKVYEEQKKAFDAQQQAAAKGKTRDGRPRWMMEAEEGEAGGAGWDEGKPTQSGGFRDDDEEDEPAPRSGRPAPKANGHRPDRSALDTRPKQTSKETYISSKERADLLFADEPKSSYKSPARHRKPAATPTEPIRSSRVATPVQLITRKLVDAEPGQVQSSAASKSKGNEHFKLGRFTEAETAYSTAISSLPTGHILLVPLWNNRAAARLKLGHSEGVVTDCTAVIDFIGPTYHPSKETPLPSEFSDIKLGDALVKATIKRAQAQEMAEKWKLAVEDWSRIMAFDNAVLGSAGTNTRNLAAEGMRRAKRMLESPGDSSQLSAQPAPKVPSRAATVTPRPPPSKPADVDRSKAVSELRRANAVNDAEDAQRMALKDSVEARLNAWKGGKESNLRALIASLDSVLWDEILQGGLKVGMHELIAEKQVKIKYMKVIARLHPDKVSELVPLWFLFPFSSSRKRVRGHGLKT